METCLWPVHTRGKQWEKIRRACRGTGSALYVELFKAKPTTTKRATDEKQLDQSSKQNSCPWLAVNIFIDNALTHLGLSPMSGGFGPMIVVWLSTRPY